MRRWTAVTATTLVLLACWIPQAGARYPLDPGPHAHYGYPRTPSGQDEIVTTFGQPCSAGAHANSARWEADGRIYVVNFHRKLGGVWSSNLDVDIPGHTRAGGYVLRRGVWGYACRTVAGTGRWSTHAWGIAVDINSFYEHVGHAHCHSISSGLGRIWRSHGWKWGLDFRDCMHFQYATDY